ncbi:MAG: Succinyl-CoA:coenzyme A transferase [Firmicutes bacterium]|nr:Succinyl-CoA:coenzyme A transferase [Bacillota bacterium]
MAWRDEYARRLTCAETAVSVVQSGHRVVIGHACGEPQVLVKALVDQAKRLVSVELVHMVAMGKADYCQPGMEAHFRHNALFVGASTRRAVHENRADYTPCFFSEIPRLFTDGYLPVDIALIQVSQPDAHGFCSFGVSVDYTRAAAKAAHIVVAQINDQMPRALGDCFIHVTEMDHIVEASVPLIELPRPNITDVEEKIGYQVAQMIENGSTLQLGIGAIPDAVLSFLGDKRNLGIHTEMFSDGVVDLIEAGVVNNQAKSLHPGKVIATFLMGTKKLYDFVDNNPLVEMHSASYTNDPFVIARNSRMVSINSALQIDLTGQICADSIGGKQFSGVGGQVDFVRGASRSAGGKSIIALPSTALDGEVSRIVRRLDEGAAVTTSRNDVHFVVTEYGYVDLRGKSLRARAESLAQIAHPIFRQRLLESVR